MTSLLAIVLLVAAGSAGLGAPWALALLIPGLLLSGRRLGSSRSAPARTQQAGTETAHDHEQLGEQRIAVIYERRGRLILRRVKEKP